MRDVTLVILNSLRIKCHIRRPLMQNELDAIMLCLVSIVCDLIHLV